MPSGAFMIQILGLRKFTPKDKPDTEKTYDAFHDKHWRAKSVPDLFKNITKYIEMIPERDRWNIFYTVAHCNEGKRDFKSLGVIAFDIDNVPKEQIDKTIEVVLRRIKLNKVEVGIVDSGHGLHFIVGLKSPKAKIFYKNTKPHYKALADSINRDMEAAGLKGRTDTSVFEPRRILRLPMTINRKPGKQDAWCRLLQPLIKPVDFDIVELSGLPLVKAKDQLETKKLPLVDPPSVMQGCEFLKYCKKNPNDISEAQWYAALSITARLNGKDEKDGYEWSHELSKGYNGYDPDETDQKIEQALQASGPRTCDNINGLWDNCGTCPNHQKITSPILIRGEDCIPTETNGFHYHPADGKGKPTPAYDDLRRYFERETNYKGLGGSGMVHVWKNKHYQYLENRFLSQYAQEKFDPKATMSKRRELVDLVTSTNLKPMDWWATSPRRKINFQNGYFDLDDMEFKAHSPSIGFRYVLPYKFDSEAKAPVFKNMLADVTGGNQKLQDVLLEFMGYALSSDSCWIHKALVLVGDGANGKSTFVNVLRNLAGIGNYTSFSIDHLNKSEYNRQLLDGKLFNVAEETPTKALMDSSLFKLLVGGGEVQVRSPYKEPYFFRSSAKYLFCCNALPDALDTSMGFLRRFIIVPFDQTFTAESGNFDPFIEDKLKEELPGIFNMCMEGYKRLKEQGDFTASDEIKKQVREYQLDNDTVLAWFDESVVVEPNGGFDEHFSPMMDLYLNYRYYIESRGKKPINMNRFSRRLFKLIPNYDKHYRIKKMNKKTTRGLQGVRYEEYS